MQYKALQADSFGSAPSGSYTDSISPTQPSTSSNATLTFTPLIAGYWAVSVSCSVTVTDTKTNQYWGGRANAGPEDLTSYTLDITYTGPLVGGSDNGTVVTNEFQDVHAGWPINLGVIWEPSDLASMFAWTISGAGGNGAAAISGYTATATSASVATLNADNDPGNAFGPYYYTKTDSLEAGVTTKNGFSVPPVHTTFNVAGPTTTLTADYQYPTRVMTDPISGGPDGVLYLQQTGAVSQPSFTSDSQAGILFKHPAVNSTTFKGHTYFVQVYQFDHAYTGLNGVQDWSFAETALDNGDPYSGNNQSAGVDSTVDGPQVPTDGLAGSVNYSPVTVNDNPTMWVMYRPAASGSIDVPLANSPWSWGGTATYSAAEQSWSFAGATPATAGNAPASPIDVYPVWTTVYTNGSEGLPPK